MVLQKSGEISFSQIRTEYNLSGSFSLAGNGRGLDSRVPQSGEISLSNFHNKNYYPKDGLQLWIDTRESTSYSGTGNDLNDLSGKNNKFTLANTNAITYITGTYPYKYNDGSIPYLNSIGNTTVSGVTYNANATGPTSDKFGFSNTNPIHTIEIVAQPSSPNNNNSIVWFNNDNNTTRMINIHFPWENDKNVYYDVDGCCGGNQRINVNINQTVVNGYYNIAHWVFRTRSDTTPYRQIFKNNVSIANSGSNTTNSSYYWGGNTYLFNYVNSNFWKGKFYLIRIWNRALSDTEIQNSYNTLNAIYNFTT